jgi:hypothetical protein
MSVKTDKFRQYTTRSCKLIPIEIDRLEYLLKYVIKNYFIKHANQVPNGDFYPKWMYNNAKETYSENTGAMARIEELEDVVGELQKAKDDMLFSYEKTLHENHDLQNKLATINRISSNE